MNAGGKGSSGRLMFIFDEPALVIEDAGKRYLVVGDLHIGLEAKLRDRGVHVYGLAVEMAKKIRRLMKEFGAERLVMLGDIKESVLYPDLQETRSIKSFFNGLEGVEMRLAEGNHDAHLAEIIGHQLEKEIIIGRYALLHGNAFPSEAAMKSDYIITAHNHVSVSIKDKRGTVYRYKAWMISKVSRNAGEYYKGFNKNAKLISMPAFNELILGTGAERFSQKENLNPLLRNNLFGYKNAELYLLSGDFAGTPSSLKSRT